MSYVHSDDEHENGRLTKLREHLSAEVRAQTGEEFPIFQDRQDILWGQVWQKRIYDTLDSTTFFIPIITPSFFKSSFCRDELLRFLKREKELRRDDLILPIYYIDSPLLNDQAKRNADPLAQAIGSHNYADFRKLRFKPVTSTQVRREIEKLAIQIRDALQRRPTTQRRTKLAAIPSVTIISPKDEEHCPHAVHLEGSITNMPQGFQLWVIKEPHPNNFHVDTGPVIGRTHLKFLK